MGWFTLANQTSLSWGFEWIRGVRCRKVKWIQLSHKILLVLSWNRTTSKKRCTSQTQGWNHCMWTVPRTCTNDHHLRLRYADPTLVGSSKSLLWFRSSLPYVWHQPMDGYPLEFIWDSWRKIASFEIEGQINNHKSCIFSTTQIMIKPSNPKKQTLHPTKKTHEPFFISALNDLPKRNCQPPPLRSLRSRRLLRKGSEFLRASATSAGLRELTVSPL